MPLHLPALLGAWGAPPDGPAWAALAAGGAALLVAVGPARAGSRKMTDFVFVAILAFTAALLSLGYVAYYLRGGPRIIDATSYFLQARGLAEGHFAWRVPEPSASFRGRFLLPHDDAIAGIFPPGYPLLLSLGFAVGAPFVVGPFLAAGIVAATWALGRELAREAGVDPGPVARTAACLSVVCGALRYHTADTMAHGACALAVALAVLAALRARRGELPWFFLLAGLPLGFLAATRFASALALGAVLLWIAFGGRAKAKALVACALGALPGVLLLLIAQSAATGHLFGATQSAYYAASDGPPGCFRYGFGHGIGCLVEHGDFVRAWTNRVDGYGLLAALGVTARRLRMHLEDVANFEPLALLVLVPLVRREWRRTGVRACGALVGAIIVAYAPFYFDGDYPAGGARFFADVLPVEHALIALGIALVAQTALATARASASVIALALAGFAVHAAYDHEQLRARDGGHPMFDPEVLADRSVGVTPKDGSPAPPTLVFVETDHGFSLAHDPALAERAADAIARGDKPSGLVVARLRNDDNDRLLYERLGRPTSWVYRFLPDSPKTMAQAAARRHDLASGELQPWSLPAVRSETWTFEGESEWPPLAQTGSAWAEPIWATDTCALPAGAGRALALHASGEGGTVTLELPVPRAGTWRATPRFLVQGEGWPRLELTVLGADDAVLAHWSPTETGLANGANEANGANGANGANAANGARGATKACIDAPAKTFLASSDRSLRLALHLMESREALGTALVALDRVSLTPTPR